MAVYNRRTKSGFKREMEIYVETSSQFMADLTFAYGPTVVFFPLLPSLSKRYTMSKSFKNEDGTVNMDGLKGHLDFVKG